MPRSVRSTVRRGRVIAPFALLALSAVGALVHAQGSSAPIRVQITLSPAPSPAPPPAPLPADPSAPVVTPPATGGTPSPAPNPSPSPSPVPEPSGSGGVLLPPAPPAPPAVTPPVTLPPVTQGPAPAPSPATPSVCTSSSQSAASAFSVRVACSASPFVSIGPWPGQTVGATFEDVWRARFGPGRPLPGAGAASTLLQKSGGTLTGLSIQLDPGSEGFLEMLISF